MSDTSKEQERVRSYYHLWKIGGGHARMLEHRMPLREKNEKLARVAEGNWETGAGMGTHFSRMPSCIACIA